MNVKQAFERLKGARAYSGANFYRIAPTAVPHIRYHGHPGVRCAACDELDKSYKDAVDTLEQNHTQCVEWVETARRQGQVSHEFRTLANRAEAGELEALKSRDEAQRLQAVSDARAAWLRLQLDNTQAALQQLTTGAQDRYNTLVNGMRDRVRDLLKELVRRTSTDYAKKLVGETTGAVILSTVKPEQFGELEHAIRTKLEAVARYNDDENLPRYSINHEYGLETVNATPDSPRKAVRGDIFDPMMIRLDCMRLSYNSPRAPRSHGFPSPEAMARHAFKSSRPVSAVPHDMAVDNAKIHLTGMLRKLQVDSGNTTPAIVANQIENLIDVKLGSRRYQK